ncbi:uncharacterized protein LOC106062329 [Biomphalaria glabrata]|uniref:Uncharacterized protein LOC106062329 n=1 Tax=Biomphalaria glabrata TaxID=6526 RepID=A0A9U8E871_BIOGL|nr:uncharacterized protein LOC106062329 [Biomphalaria glabrata]
MAPPGVNSFFDHMDTLSAFGPCYYHSPFSIAPKPSLQPLMSPPAIKATLSSPLSSSRVETDILSILSDHDYTSKPSGGLRRGVADVKEECSEDEAESSLDNGSSSGDAMLSSAADFSNEIVADTDFLQELDSLDFTDLDPCTDVAMEDSFQDFIDSVLDKSRPPFFGGDDSDSIQHEAVILNQEEFLGFLGLQPAGSSIVVQPDVSLCKPDIVCPDIPVPSEAVPTKKCSSCSQWETVSRVVYSSASSHTYTTVPARSDNNVTIKQSRFPLSTLSVMSPKQMLPLTIDTSFDFASELSGQLCGQVEDVAMQDAVKQQGSEDDATRDLLNWLQEDPIEPRVSNSAAEQQKQLIVLAPSLDLESFVDLEDFVQDSSCPQMLVHQNNDATSNCNGYLKFSFLSTDRHSQHFGYNEDIVGSSCVKSSLDYYSSPDSPVSSRSWPCSNTASPSSSPSASSVDLSSAESTQLALLNLFSEENASVLHSIEDSDLRFI